MGCCKYHLEDELLLQKNRYFGFLEDHQWAEELTEVIQHLRKEVFRMTYSPHYNL